MNVHIPHMSRDHTVYALYNTTFLKKQQISSASGLVVKFNVAIVEPPVRFRACAYFLDYFWWSRASSNRGTETMVCVTIMCL